MRRTALLASAALLTGLLPLLSAGAATADEPAPVPVDRFEGEVPFANPPPGACSPGAVTRTTRPRSP